MVSLVRYLFLCCLVLLTACKKHEFNLEFNMAASVTDNYNVTYYASDKKGAGKTIQAVASIRDGKCELKGITIRPTLLYLDKRNSKLPLVIYAQNGNKIEISGDSIDPLAWKVGGNKINESLTDWRLLNKKILEECNADSVNKAVETFVNDNPDNPVSAILMLNYYNRGIDERGYDLLMNSLEGKAADIEWLRLTSRADQLLPQYATPARLVNMVMRSTGKSSTDTLYVNKRDPLFVAFWQTGYQERKTIVDSIKAMEKEFPDSSRMIADICLDIDSLGWRNAIRRDSLDEDMKRFWVASGLTHPKMVKLKVTSLPFFIVFTKDGFQEYRGTSLEKAIETYRELLKPSEEEEK